MSKMSDMTEYHASAYRLPSGFEHCSKLKPVVEAVTALDRVKAVVDVLYSPGGCPWDGKQTNESLLKNLLEETYEYVDAVETHDRDNMREELGDVLLQSVFQARVCESDAEGPFGIDEVADRLMNKLITRHPHAFAADDAGNSSESSDAFDADGNDGRETTQPESPEAVVALWEKMKQQESIVNPCLRAFPALKVRRLARPKSFLVSPNRRMLIDCSRSLMSRLRLTRSKMTSSLKRRFNPNQMVTILLNMRRPMPTPMKSSPSCVEPARTVSILKQHCATVYAMLNHALNPLKTTFGCDE